MPSGQFHSIQASTIIKDKRQRHDLGDISVLADSISRLGLIHPLVVTRDHVLVAGERRLAACTSLGWTHIPCQYADEVVELKCVELEENVKRKDLTWQEQSNAIFEYHNIRKAADPDWTQEKTGKALGLTKNSISEHLSVASELAAGNERVINAPKFSTAIGVVDRAQERKDQESLLQLRSIGRIKAPEAEEENIINGNFLEWAPVYEGPRYNFLHCDFPYGIGADSFNQGAAPTHGGYDDSESTYWSLCRCLASNYKRFTTDSCHIMFWFSMHYYAETLDFFTSNTDFVLDPFPLVWLKSDNVGIIPDPQRGPRRIYETALFGSRGDRKVVSPISNAYAAPTDRSQHMSIKPEPVLRNFFRMFVDESTLMLDPTCGSGSSLRAAESLNARYVYGIEVNKEFADGANRALKSSRALRRKPDAKRSLQTKEEERSEGASGGSAP